MHCEHWISEYRIIAPSRNGDRLLGVFGHISINRSIHNLVSSFFCVFFPPVPLPPPRSLNEECVFSEEIYRQDLIGAKFIIMNTHWIRLFAKLVNIILQMKSVLQMLSVTLRIWVLWVICVTEYYPSPCTLGRLDFRALELCKYSCFNSYLVLRMDA